MTDAYRLHFEIDGLSCAGCAGRASRALANVPGVTGADVNFATRTAQVTASDATPMQMAEALKAAGYPARTETVTLDVSEMSCASCAGRVEAALKSVPGGLEAGVNFAAGAATVHPLAGPATPA